MINRFPAAVRRTVGVVLASLLLAVGPARAEESLTIGYLSVGFPQPPALSNLDVPPEDLGLAGAELGLADNATTGRFLKQSFKLEIRRLDEGADPLAHLRDLAEAGVQVVVLDMPAVSLDRVIGAKDLDIPLLINAGAPDNRFREADCRANLLHTLPSRAMLMDGLAQYLIKKQWSDWFLITGPRPEDRLFAASVKRAAKRFGAKIVAEKAWTGEYDARRTAQTEIPIFTQGVDYDVLMVADEIGDFGDYLMYRTFEPKVVAGTQGLVPAAWGRAVEQWGAAQLQERFFASKGRPMRPRDWAAWMAVRTLGEAATRTKSIKIDDLKAFIYSPKLRLAGFKGRKLQYRHWNGQLRQSIPLLTARSVVSLSPQEGFLHPTTELDTLGFDEPETQCPTPLWSVSE
ncbi:MAG: ABC transporter substrate-binding protein [Magnetovibrionaceae bacterium]